MSHGMRARAVLAGILGALLLAAPALGQGFFPGNDEIRRRLDERLARGGGVGVVVGLLEADGTRRFVVAGSSGNAVPLDERALFEIGSITKVFTSLVLAAMVAAKAAGAETPAPGSAEKLNVLFIAVTAPAMAEPTPRRVKQRIMALFQRPPQWAKLAREFNSWLADPTHGWLSSYGGGNVKVFDYYDILTRHGESDWLLYPTHNGRNSHPSREGNQLASEAFVPFLLDAWQGLQSAELGRSQP